MNHNQWLDVCACEHGEDQPPHYPTYRHEVLHEQDPYGGAEWKMFPFSTQVNGWDADGAPVESQYT